MNIKDMTLTEAHQEIDRISIHQLGMSDRTYPLENLESEEFLFDEY